MEERLEEAVAPQMEMQQGEEAPPAEPVAAPPPEPILPRLNQVTCDSLEPPKAPLLLPNPRDGSPESGEQASRNSRYFEKRTENLNQPTRITHGVNITEEEYQIIRHLIEEIRALLGTSQGKSSSLIEWKCVHHHMIIFMSQGGKSPRIG